MSSYYMVFPLLNKSGDSAFESGFGYPTVGVVEISIEVFQDITFMNNHAVNRSIPIIQFETAYLNEIIAFDGEQSIFDTNTIGEKVNSHAFTVANPVDFEEVYYTIYFYKSEDIDLTKIGKRIKMNKPQLNVSGRSFSIEASMINTDEGFISPYKPLKNMNSLFETRVLQ